MRAPDFSLSYPSGAKAIEIVGVEGDVFEYLRLAPAMLSMAIGQLSKLQPLINDFYDIYTKIKKLEQK
jgi:hypothetical protein